MLQIRQDLARASTAKLPSDARPRTTMTACGLPPVPRAATGRWSGMGIRPQELPASDAQRIPRQRLSSPRSPPLAELSFGWGRYQALSAVCSGTALRARYFRGGFLFAEIEARVRVARRPARLLRPVRQRPGRSRPPNREDPRHSCRKGYERPAHPRQVQLLALGYGMGPTSSAPTCAV